MRKTLTQKEFVNACLDTNLSKVFSLEGLSVLFEMATEWEEITGEAEFDANSLWATFEEFSIQDLLKDERFESLNKAFVYLQDQGEIENDVDAHREIHMLLSDTDIWFKWIDSDRLIIEIDSL